MHTHTLRTVLVRTHASASAHTHTHRMGSWAVVMSSCSAVKFSPGGGGWITGSGEGTGVLMEKAGCLIVILRLQDTRHKWHIFL